MSHEPLRVFVGYDSKEPVAYHVLSHSILRRASGPVSVQPVALSQAKGFYARERGPLESTEFSIARFLVPYLSGYEGLSVFMDCDMLVRCDLLEVLAHADPSRAVSVVKHDYRPKPGRKFLGAVQTAYPRKNWSSFVVFNNRKCRALTPDYVASASGLDLHRFKWCEDSAVGNLPREWNWLVGEYGPNPRARVLHYTRGGPWFPEFEGCDHAGEWYEEFKHALGPLDSVLQVEEGVSAGPGA